MPPYPFLLFVVFITEMFYYDSVTLVIHSFGHLYINSFYVVLLSSFPRRQNVQRNLGGYLRFFCSNWASELMGLLRSIDFWNTVTVKIALRVFLSDGSVMSSSQSLLLLRPVLNTAHVCTLTHLPFYSLAVNAECLHSDFGKYGLFHWFSGGVWMWVLTFPL